jgi:hypothetical protein
MDADLRSLAWNAVERVFAELHLVVGTSFPVAIMVKVRAEEAVANVRSELARAGLEVANVEKRWWPFGRRWSIAAKSKPVPIARIDIDRWLNSLEANLARHDAVVTNWVPLIP